MEHKEKSLIKLFDRLIKDRLNKEFADRDLDERILNVKVKSQPNVNDLVFGDLNSIEEYDEFYSVYVYLKNGEINRNIALHISYLIFNASEYVLTGNFVIRITFFNKNEGYIRHMNFYSDGVKSSESRSLDIIITELENIELY